VRTPEEWAQGIIKGAVKMNFYDADFSKQIETLDKTQPIYVYCKAGGRSGKTAKQLEKLGFTKVYDLDGGIGAWDEAGYKKVK
jgi:rhodanese-related sulfurtransferase